MGNRRHVAGGGALEPASLRRTLACPFQKLSRIPVCNPKHLFWAGNWFARTRLGQRRSHVGSRPETRSKFSQENIGRKRGIALGVCFSDSPWGRDPRRDGIFQQ